MITMNSVQLVGKVTLPPRVRTLKSGTKLADVGLGVAENVKKQDGSWDRKMHFVDLILWDQLAEMAGSHIKKGDGLLVQGSLHYESWEDKEGKKRNKIRVKAQRVQRIDLPAPVSAPPDAA